ncbi:hypothetical protein CPC08DRAFT_324731 [Agrocybe pediades]|nr:hypothetical protein CPC08DRAFT_324731 [Agrocybe pediades]
MTITRLLYGKASARTKPSLQHFKDKIDWVGMMRFLWLLSLLVPVDMRTYERGRGRWRRWKALLLHLHCGFWVLLHNVVTIIGRR